MRDSSRVKRKEMKEIRFIWDSSRTNYLINEIKLVQ